MGTRPGRLAGSVRISEFVVRSHDQGGRGGEGRISVSQEARQEVTCSVFHSPPDAVQLEEKRGEDQDCPESMIQKQRYVRTSLYPEKRYSCHVLNPRTTPKSRISFPPSKSAQLCPPIPLLFNPLVYTIVLVEPGIISTNQRATVRTETAVRVLARSETLDHRAKVLRVSPIKAWTSSHR
ncbi:hypothetical protein RRG08_020832 [Elysia crispata]|uniref:Uncharacterized protein n=1 Tax=Elysia crispata TaxID=231223 RepID=A0AAE1CN43_9GAST|nr:hypothetical protein RRG08_020832 [Elysia crispata]